jgi:hypothetical protein
MYIKICFNLIYIMFLIIKIKNINDFYELIGLICEKHLRNISDVILEFVSDRGVRAVSLTTLGNYGHREYLQLKVLLTTTAGWSCSQIYGSRVVVRNMNGSSRTWEWH